jgi:broad specificity phosphatase PhoE
VASRVLIVQHAEKQRLPGDPGLTEAGHAQAEAVAAFLASRSDITHVFSSPLGRARATAEPIAKALGLEVRTDDRLRERMNWEGPAIQSLEAFLEDWSRASRERDYQPISGDSSRVAGQRLRGFVDGLSPAETVVVVSHGGVTTDLLRDLLGDEDLEAGVPGLIGGGIPAGAITTLERNIEDWTAAEIASVRHLPEATTLRPA